MPVIGDTAAAHCADYADGQFNVTAQGHPMNPDGVFALATLLPSTSAQSLLSAVLICAVVLGAASLFSLTRGERA